MVTELAQLSDSNEVVNSECMYQSSDSTHSVPDCAHLILAKAEDPETG